MYFSCTYRQNNAFDLQKTYISRIEAIQFPRYDVIDIPGRIQNRSSMQCIRRKVWHYHSIQKSRTS